MESSSDFLNRLTFDRIMVVSLRPRFFGPPCMSEPDYACARPHAKSHISSTQMFVKACACRNLKKIVWNWARQGERYREKLKYCANLVCLFIVFVFFCVYSCHQVKSKVCSIPVLTIGGGVHLPSLGLEPRSWTNHWSLWRMATATPDLRLPSQPQSITAPWPVPNYTA